MKIYSPFTSRTVLAMLCGAGLALSIGTFRANADQWDKKTIVTIDQPVQVSRTLLEPGQYVFKLLNSPADRHVVQIFNANQSQIIDTVLAIPNYRLAPTGHTQFMFWETPPGYARALRAWFYPGDNFGQEFRYPAHLALLQTASAARVTTEEQVQQAEQTAQTEQPQPPAVEEQQPEVAQNEAPPEQPAQPAPAPAPEQPAPPPADLPKTSSPYPLFGFAGLLALGLYGVLRLKRAS